MPTIRLNLRIARVSCASSAIALFLASGSANAEIGTVQIQTEDPSPLETEAPPTETNSTSTLPIEAPETNQITAVEEGVNRPWLLHTSAGQTAFVLDAKQFEIGIPINGSTQLSRHVYGYSLLLLDGHFGLTDSLTLNVISDSSIALASAKWNFWNGEAWSLSVSPSIGYQFRQSDSYYTEKHSPIGIALMASGVFNGRHRLHIGLELAKDSEKGSYEYNYQNYRSTSKFVTDLTEARMAAAYEYRFNRRHGMTTWLAPTYSHSSWSSTSSISGSADYTSLTSSSKLLLAIGIGYQYFLQRFGLQIGADVGPYWRRYYGGFYEYNDLSVSGSISGGLSFRL